jgi:hypothetical protein
VVTVAVYSTTPFDMLAKVVDGGAAPESAAEARHNGSGWQTLSFDFNALKIIQLLRIDRIILFFPLWKLGGGFKPAAVTTTYVDNISGKAGAVIVAELDQLDRHPEAQVIINSSTMVLSPVAPQYSNLAGVTFDPFSPDPL